MQRIKYDKVKENQYVTKTYYDCDVGKVIGFYETAENTYKIINIITNEVVASGSGTSPHKLKINIKKALLTLGVEVGRKEKRKKRENETGQQIVVSSERNSQGLSDQSSEGS